MQNAIVHTSGCSFVTVLSVISQPASVSDNVSEARGPGKRDPPQLQQNGCEGPDRLAE